MQTVIISGTSTGIGLAAVKKFLNKNIRVIALYRGSKPHITENELLHFVHCELSEDYSVNNAAIEIMALCEGHDVIALINNAGYGQYGAIEDIDRMQFEYQMSVNVHGPVQLTVLLMPLLRQSVSRIIMISSVLGFTSTALRGAYSASKHALEAISDTLRLELAHTGIKTILIEPGPVKTEFRKTACKHIQECLNAKPNTHYKSDYARFIGQTLDTKGIVSAEHVADIIYTASTIKTPKIRYRICRQTWLAWLGKRILSSRLFDYLILRNRA